MKSTVNQKEEVKEKGFPKLMITPHTGTIVLFFETENGIVLNRGCGNKSFCQQSKIFIMSHFKDFDGTLTLSND
jgi:Na+-transporting NADH:ubiquinone oxidoreductase subunit NqrF